MNKKITCIVLLFVSGIYACHKDVMEIFAGFQQPVNFPVAVYHFNSNPVTKDGFGLGRKLFYDPILSANNTISCGSCHMQTAAFTHNGHSVSHGILDRLGTRNSPPIMNLAWSSSFMWDGGIFDLDLQPIAPVTNHVEMDDSVENVLARLRSSMVYPGLFKKAFGTDEINSTRFLKALAQFMVMCVSSNAKYDSVMRNQAAFTVEENEGYAIFKQKCNNCHAEPLFTDYSFRNNGLPPSEADDKGRYTITLNNNDRYKFKVPSLRNLNYTPPYMHDGRFFTLDAVLDHYTGGVKSTPNLDTVLHQDNRLGIDISAVEKTKLLAFLETLNDKVFVRDKRFAEQ